MLTDQDLYKALVSAGIDPVQVGAVQNYLKDNVPARNAFDTRIYSNSPFTTVQDEITSLAIQGGGPLVNWMPMRSIEDRYQVVSHLDYVTPQGFTGRETYPEWLSSIEIGECGYGPSTTFSGFNYQQSGATMSWKTGTMKPYEDGGMSYYEKMPIYTVRGVGQQMISDDRTWAIARVLMAVETHLDYVVRSGDSNNSQMEWDGLDQIIRPGYVASRLVGSGTPTWADPIVVNGATLTVAQVIEAIRVISRRIIRRAQARNWQIANGDMVVFMPQAMWDVLAEHVAAGAMDNFVNKSATYGFNGQISASEYRSAYEQTRAGGPFGTGSLRIDGRDIAVMTDVNYGATRDIVGAGGQGVLGDIFILVRRAGGMTLLEQQYVNWNKLNYPALSETTINLQNGVVRAGWVTESNKCFYYYAEMAGRVVCTMLPLQARINNVFVPMANYDTIEAGAFYAQDYYAFGGRRGGNGVDLLAP